MYVYRALKFDEELSKIKKLSSRVDNLCSQLETMSYLDAKARFKKLHLYLKRKEGNFRLIARTLKIDREPILCFLKVYNRGEPDYRHFLEEIKQHTELFDECQLRPKLPDWLAQEKRKNKGNQQSLSILPDRLRIWLERPKLNIYNDDLIIHETEIWCKKFNQPAIRGQATAYLQLIEEIINNNFLGKSTYWEDIKLHTKNNISILYIVFEQQTSFSQKILLLIAPLENNTTQSEIHEIIKVLINHNNNFHNLEYSHGLGITAQQRNKLILDILLARTKRSYPGYLVLEKKFWLKIQDGDGVNLTLSNEEKEILNSVSTDKNLPLFLNGRAGSGKSTMLFYLFAYYCNQHLQLCHEKELNILEQPHPLFLTYSKNLSDFAKDKVQFLLRHHHLFVEDTTKLPTIPDIKSFFQPFRPFLLNLLPLPERKLFPAETHVSFYYFKEFCRTRWKKISPEKCWLVIQNFIKGYELDEKDSYLEDEHYYSELIPKKDRSISVEEFIEIRDRVWKTYREYLKKNNLWDDRDLIRAVLSLGCYKPQYTAIFCDEAQDFTRLELQLIMRVSAFSHYDLEQEHIFSLPFACAGDPLQTLNPSGFRWDSFKAAFYDEVLTPLDLNYQSSLKIELTPLKYNYRSVESIVKVNNLIQLWRKILFGFSDITPQISRKINSIFCKKFIINNNLGSNDITQYLKNTIILIPCDEGEEIDFVLQDNILKELINSSEPSKLPWNILSAISAKGLEFKQVIVYKFGERCPSKLWDIKKDPSEKEKYFLNKLYVAASRATERLFIIDSLEGDQKLWYYSSNLDKLNYFLSRIEDKQLRQQWRENTDLIYPSDSLSQLEYDDLEANALTFETVGIQGENIDFLERAIAIYQTSNNKLKVKLCRAWKLRFEKNFFSAGKLFLELGKIAESWDCFWQALAWKELKQILLYQIFLNTNNSEYLQFVVLLPLIDFMLTLEKKNQFSKLDLYIQKFWSFTDFLIQESQQKSLTDEYQTKPWKTAISNYQSLVKKLIYQPDSIPESKWLESAQILLNWYEEESEADYVLIAKCFAFAKDYQKALVYWEKFGYPDRAIDRNDLQQYYLTKARLTPLPQALEYLEQAQKYALIINLWIDYGRNLDYIWLKYVAIAYELTHHFEQAFIVYCYLDRTAKVKYCWQQIQLLSKKPKYLKKIVSYYLDKKHWHEAIIFAKENLNHDHFPYLFVYSLGQSQLLPDCLDKSEKYEYQNFIQQYILHNSQWQQYFPPQYIGIVLEKIGLFNNIFTFYEHYVECNDWKLRLLSRDRWLTTKQQQVKYFQATNQLKKKNKAQQELTNFANQWNFNLKNLSYCIPKIKVDKHQIPKQSWRIKGLPSNVVLKNIAEGIYQFQLHHLIVRLVPSNRQIAIADISNRKIIRFDGRSNKLLIDTTIVTLSNNHALSLQNTSGSYSLTISLVNSLHLKLAFNDYFEKINIEFSNL